MQRYTRTDSDYKGPIPKGEGFDIQFNVTEMVIDWIKHPLAPQEIVIKTTKQWMRQIIMFDSNSKNVSTFEVYFTFIILIPFFCNVPKTSFLFNND